jgi:hypothetical protein
MTGAKLRDIGVALTVVVGLLVVVGCAASDGGDRATAERPQQRARGPTSIVTRVVDGDTVELDNGKTVRLIGRLSRHSVA